MNSSESFAKRFREALSAVPAHIRERVNAPGGLNEAKLLDLLLQPEDNGVDGPLQPDDAEVEKEFPAEECFNVGIHALNSGQVAYCILAGGAGSRFGEPKALARIPGLGMSLLTLKMFQAAGTGPVWIVTSPSLKSTLQDHIANNLGLDQNRIQIFEQFESYRLTPDNNISVVDGQPDLYPCGHGDVFPLLSGGILQNFVESGGKYVAIVNVDNVFADLNPFVVGRHILAKANVSCEVVERNANDSGGVLCRDRGQLQIVESYRIYNSDPLSYKWLNTNSFIFNANLNLAPLGTAWNRVKKSIDGRVVVQHERLLQEITEAYDTQFFKAERCDRFMPIKTLEDLEKASELLKKTNIL